MVIRRAARAAFWLGIAAGLIAFVTLVNPPDRSMFWSALFDAGHAPLFGLFALMILWAAAAWGGSARRRTRGPATDRTAVPTVAQARPVRIRNYLLALSVTVALGGLTEILQGLGSRDTELWDFIRDVLGGAAALLLAFVFDRRANSDQGPHPARRRSLQVTMVLTAAALLATAFLRVTTVAVAYLSRDAAFPLICEFDHRWEDLFVGVKDAVLIRGEPPVGWGREASNQAARVTFLPAQYPGMSIREPHPDWRGYDRLVFEVYSEALTPVDLVLRINDAHHNNDYADRFNRVLVIQPGANRVSISLDDVRHAPTTRPMDLAHIRGLSLFAVDPPLPFSVYVDAFRLER